MKIKIIIFIFLMTLISIYFLGDTKFLNDYITSLRQQVGPFSIAILAILYAVLLSIPFVAGVEIGICLMGLFGAKGIVAAYFGTILGLSLAFTFGKVGVFKNSTNLDIKKLINEVRGFSFFIPRWLSLALLINLPGNAFIGGGGGIAMIFGLEGRLSFKTFFLIIAIATMPVPAMVFMGIISF